MSRYKLSSWFFEKTLPVLISIFLALFCTFILITLCGENFFNVLGILISGSIGSFSDFSFTLFYATPLFLTGLSVSWALRAGLFNVGAEGQMVMGGLGIAVVGILFPQLPSAIAWPLSILIGFLFGGIWGGIAGWMKAYRGCHEVLATILLNFVSYGTVSYFVLHVFRNTSSQAPETVSLGSGYLLPGMGALTGPLNFSFFIGIGILILASLVMNYTVLGFQQRLSGEAPLVARLAGLPAQRHTLLALFISGGLAGLGSLNDILGYSMKLREGFTAGAGFTGIAVALLGKNRALGIFFAALFLGALHKGSLNLDLDTERITRDVAMVIQALFIIFIAAERGIRVTLRFLKGFS